MKQKTMGISIPYYKNTDQCETAFKELMKQIDSQLTDKMELYIYEDGQVSDWLKQYEKKNVKIVSCLENKGVSHARNESIEYLKNKVLYILFLDSDDRLDDDYLKVMYEYCYDNSHEIIESGFYNLDAKIGFDRNVVRCGCAGSAIQTRIIGDIRFDETLQIGEDTDFMYKVCDLTKYRKKFAPTYYYYQLGTNPESLTMKHRNGKIGLRRI